MSILIVVLCIALLILFISQFKINAFLSFLIVSILGGLLLGLEPSKIIASVQLGVGDMLGELAIIVIGGAMLGKLVAESGAAQRITSGMMSLFGPRYVQWALMATGFLIGIPLFYTVAFVLIIPLIFSVVYRYKLPAVYIGLPMIAALSVTHGFLPPHPSPTALVAQFHADLGQTLLYGFIVAIPTVILAGPVFAQTLKHINPPLKEQAEAVIIPNEKLPGLANSILTSLLPVIFLAITTIIQQTVVVKSGMLLFISNPAVVILISLAIATYTLGINRNMSMKHIMDIYAESVKDIAMILLIMGGAGGLKQILKDSGVSHEIAVLLNGLDVNPLILGWLIASLIRVSVGSATVAGLTAASIMLPLMGPTVDPNLMVLSIGAGSLMFSHVNDAGFWMFKEFFNLSLKQTIRSWSLMETIVAVSGLAGVLIINSLK